MSKKIFLPESVYDVNSEMNYKKLSVFYDNSVSIIGKVIRLNSEEDLFEVDIGGGLIGIMPFDEATIYPIYTNVGGTSPNIYKLVGKNIQAKVISLDGNLIVLSRRKNMLEALECLKYETEIKSASITGFSRLSAFIDIGAGITGRSYSKNFANTKFRDIKDVGSKIGDIISVKVMDFVEDTNCFNLSRVDALPKFQDVFNESDSVTCKVFDPVGDPEGVGYYVLINNLFNGIVDSPIYKLQYGDEIVAIISKITDKGPRLDFSGWAD